MQKRGVSKFLVLVALMAGQTGPAFSFSSKLNAPYRPNQPWLNRFVKDFSALRNYPAYAANAQLFSNQSTRIQRNLLPKLLEDLRAASSSISRTSLLSPTPYDFETEVRKRLSLASEAVEPVVFQTLMEAATAVEDDLREAQEDQNRVAAQVKRVREYASFMRSLSNSPSNALSVKFFNQDCGAPTNFITTKLAIEFDSLPDCNFESSQVIDKSQIAQLADDLSRLLESMQETNRLAQEQLDVVTRNRNHFVTTLGSLLPGLQRLSDADIQKIR